MAVETAAPILSILLIIFLILLLMAIAVLATIFWIWMIVDAAKRNFKTDNEKVVWILVIVLVGLIGAAVYYFMVKINDSRGVTKR